MNKIISRFFPNVSSVVNIFNGIIAMGSSSVEAMLLSLFENLLYADILQDLSLALH